MNKSIIHRLITYCLAAVWLINGFYCKWLNGVPRHQQIVAKILGQTHAGRLTKGIGFLEVAMGLWILSGFQSRVNCLVQIVVIGIMNALEFFLAPELLLWGKMNAVFALLLIAVIYINEYYFNTPKIPRI